MTLPLLSVFQNQIIPWAEHFGMSKIAVAQPSWRALQAGADLPDGVTATRKALRSKRTPVKGRRQYGNAALVDAYWPEDHLQSGRSPLLAYILHGAVAFPLGGYRLHCKPGHGVLIPPGVAHFDGSHLFLDDSVQDNTTCEMLMIRPYNAGMECWLSHTKNGEHYSHRNAGESCRLPCGQAVFYMEALSEEVVIHQAHYEQISGALLVALMRLLLRELQKTPQPQSTLAPQTLPSSNSGDPIIQAQRYIRNHLGEDMSLDSVARTAYMSRRRFSDQFRLHTGQSFLKYLTDCRYEEACTLLRDTDWSIEIISGFVGIKPGRLRALFHQRSGVSPLIFRQQKRKSVS